MITAELSVKFKDSRSAKAVHDALRPDNVNLPRGMQLDQKRNGVYLRIFLRVKSKESLDSLISTLDEILSHIRSAVQALEKLSKTNSL